jgi:hypothetical protein
MSNANNKIELTKELHNELVDSFQSRAAQQGFKGKEFLKLQTEFFLGAVRVIDVINQSQSSCISPKIAFSIMCGDIIQKFPIDESK